MKERRSRLKAESIESLYSHDSAEKIWRADCSQLDQLALEVLILDENFDTAFVILNKCEEYGLDESYEHHLGKSEKRDQI